MSEDFIAELAPKSMPSPMPAFFCSFLDEHDGDTYKLYVWRWGDDYKIWRRTRLARANAPEITTPAGIVAQAWIVAWVAAARPVRPHPELPFVVYTQADDNYGRPLVEVFRRSDGANLSDALLASGNAVPYPKVAI